jgi:hypothetical protein
VPPKGLEVESRNMGTFEHPPVTDTGKSRRPTMGARGGGASVVVRARESRVQGEGRQGVGTPQKPEERPVDSGHQAEQVWLLSVQTKLYQWCRDHSDSTRTPGEPDA